MQSKGTSGKLAGGSFLKLTNWKPAFQQSPLYAPGADATGQTSMSDFSLCIAYEGDDLRRGGFKAEFVLFIGFELRIRLAWSIGDEGFALQNDADGERGFSQDDFIVARALRQIAALVKRFVGDAFEDDVRDFSLEGNGETVNIPACIGREGNFEIYIERCVGEDKAIV